jgi:tRNA A37 threonylcarbamoyladenosine modification protein TsaB
VLKVDICLIAIESPILIGIYQNNNLIKTIKSDDLASEFIPIIFESLFKNYEIQNILFANGPGSFMAIKISYIFLKTISILKNIKIWSADGFFFNQNSPIKAFNNHYFKKLENQIKIVKLENPKIEIFNLPNKFDIKLYSKNIEPIYILPAV